MPIHVLFVCLGNVCRSPAAGGILQKVVDEAGLSEHFVIDSCGTASFNLGKPADPRVVEACGKRGYDLTRHIARQIDDSDYKRFDYILAMDHQNLRSVEAWAPEEYAGTIDLFMRYCQHDGNAEIPDPYYADPDVFDFVVAKLERSASGFLAHLRAKEPL